MNFELLTQSFKMFSHTKIKWTIDAELSGIFFKERCLVLTKTDVVPDEMNNELSPEELRINECFSNTMEDEEIYQEKGTDNQRTLCVKMEELAKNINYNLIIFEEKNSGDFWKRKTFSGLLIFENTGKNVLINLHRTGHSFNKCGHASATYSVTGKLNKNDFDPDRNDTDNTEMIILDSQLLFEGEVRLVQKN